MSILRVMTLNPPALLTVTDALANFADALAAPGARTHGTIPTGPVRGRDAIAGSGRGRVKATDRPTGPAR